MHKTYLFYTEQGEPSFVFSGTEEDAQIQLDNNISYDYIECTIEPQLLNQYKIVDGEFVQKTDAEILTPAYIEKQIEVINEEASGIILKAFPLWKQNNMLARVIELQMDTRSAEEETEFQTLLDNWEWIKGIRNQSNVFCEQIRNATSLAEIGNHTWVI